MLNSITYYQVREAMAAGTNCVANESESANLADVLTELRRNFVMCREEVTCQQFSEYSLDNSSKGAKQPSTG